MSLEIESVLDRRRLKRSTSLWRGLAILAGALALGGLTIAGTGDSWEEVAGALEMPSGTLSATMAFYKAHARDGSDRLVVRRAPRTPPARKEPEKVPTP